MDFKLLTKLDYSSLPCKRFLRRTAQPMTSDCAAWREGRLIGCLPTGKPREAGKRPGIGRPGINLDMTGNFTANRDFVKIFLPSDSLSRNKLLLRLGRQGQGSVNAIFSGAPRRTVSEVHRPA